MRAGGNAGRARCSGARWMLVVAALLAAGSPVGQGDVIIPESERTGMAPCAVGTGWVVECFYGIPPESATNLLLAETWAATQTPTFTFRAEYIDWPAGGPVVRPDATFATMGDFLNGYVSDLSDPAALDLPFDSFLLRATGQLDMRFEDTVFPDQLPLMWFNVGMTTWDGGRVRVGGATIFRVLSPSFSTFGWENAVILAAGTYPITATYLQRSHPETPMAGVELLSCHAPDVQGLTVNSSKQLPCPVGLPVGTPVTVIYAPGDLLAPEPGDVDGDSDVDMRDVMYMQTCYTGPEPAFPVWGPCAGFDADGDGGVGPFDADVVLPGMNGPCFVDQ